MCRSVETFVDKKMQQSKLEGIEQGKIDTAISMLKENSFTLEMIAKVCKLSLEKVKELAKELAD